MQVAALAFGVFGIGGSLIFALGWEETVRDRREDIELTRKMVETNPDPKLQAGLEMWERRANAVYALLGGAVLGVAECVLVAKQKGRIAAPLLLVAFAIPYIVSSHRGMALFTGEVAIAGVLALFGRPVTHYQRPKPRVTTSENDFPFGG